MRSLLGCEGLVHDLRGRKLHEFRSPAFSKINVPIFLIKHLLGSISHEFEACGYLIGEIENRILDVKCVEMRGNLLADLVTDSKTCLDFLKVARESTPQSLRVPYKPFWFFLKDMNLREEALEVINRNLPIENIQKCIREKAMISCIPSAKMILIGDEVWNERYEKECLTKTDCYFEIHFHSHPFGNPLLPSSCDISSNGMTETVCIIVQPGPEKTFSVLAYQSSGPAPTIVNYFFPIRRISDSLQIHIDTPKKVVIERDLDYEQWRSSGKLEQCYIFITSI